MRRLSHGRKQPNGCPGAPSDGTVRSGSTTGRCKSPALLVLTLRGRLVRVAFGLLSDVCGQTLVIILHGVHNRFAQAGR